MIGRRKILAAAALCVSVQPVAATPSATPLCHSRASAPLAPEARREIAQRSAKMAEARASGNVAARLAHYAADSITMVDHQRRLYGPSQARLYYAMLAAREKIAGFTQEPVEFLPLEEDVLERGVFRVSFAGADAQSRKGRYMQLWRRQMDGSYRLKAEVWGYSAAIDNPDAYRLDEALPGSRAAPVAEPELGAELDRLHVAEALAVRTHDPARIDTFVPDAVFVPYAEEAKVGIEQIRPFLAAYIARGSGATFDSVRTWNEGYERRGAYVIEYPKFEVAWRAGADKGVVSGGGLRIWRREPDCSLKTWRQMGTHD
jgi:ketosteroid isomerase-like protein